MAVTSLVMLLSVCAAQVAFAQAVIPPGREGEVAHMLGTDAAGECALGDIRIDRDHIEARYQCPAGPALLTITHQAVAPVGSEPGRELAVSFTGAWPDAARRELLAQIRSREPDQLWIVPVSREPDRRGSGQANRFDAATLANAVLALALVLAVIGAALRTRRARTARDTAPRAGSAPVVIAAVIAIAGAVAGLAWAAWTFRFAYDDFTKLLRADASPFAPDPELRLLGLRAPFALALKLGGARAAFAAINVATIAAWVAVMTALLGRLGLRRHHALAAAAAGVCSSYQLGLVRWGVGVQHITVWVCIAVAMLAFDDAARQPRIRGRIGAVMLGCAAALAAVLCKYPVAAALPLMTFVWCRYAIDVPGSPLRAPWFHCALAVVVAIPIVVLRATIASTEPAAAALSLGAVPANLAQLVSRGAPFALVGLGWIAVRTATIGEVTGSPRTAVAMLVVAAIAMCPFLLNGAYFADYYPAGAFVWVVAAMFIDLAPRLDARGVARGAVLAWAVSLWPWHGIAATMRHSPDNQVAAFLAEASEALAGVRTPDAISIGARCDTETRTAAADAELDQLMRASADGDGIRWVTGLHGVPVARAPSEREGERRVVLAWCPDHQPSFHAHAETLTPSDER